MEIKKIIEGLRCETCGATYSEKPVYDWESDLYVYSDFSSATRVFCEKCMTRTKTGSDITGTYEDNDTVCYGAKLISKILSVYNNGYIKDHKNLTNK